MNSVRASIDKHNSVSLNNQRIEEDLDVARRFVGEKRRLDTHRWTEVLSVSELANYARPEWDKARARMALLAILAEQVAQIHDAIANAEQRDYSVAQGGKR